VVSAVLLQDGHAFKRHSGLRAALHQRLVATGRLPQDLGRVFDDLAELRTKSVYAALFEVDAETASRLLAETRRLIEHLRPALPWRWNQGQSWLISPRGPPTWPSSAV